MKITILRTEWNPEGPWTTAMKVVITPRPISEVRGKLKGGYSARRYYRRDKDLPHEMLSGAAFLFG